MKTKITRRQREILDLMAAGWRPFPFQLSGLETGLIRQSLVCGSADDRGNTVLVLTDQGRAILSTNPR